jgi:SRSO17 transposase
MANIRDRSERRFREYLDRLGGAAGHLDRREPLEAYITGLCLPGDRKSVEPMAARVDPRHVRARHQSMHHFVANAPWEDATVLKVARDWVLEQMERHGAVAAWVVDDTGIPKKGRHSVGVARQYCGALGKQDNCQVAVSVTLANEAVSVPAGYRLYLPESWTEDRRRRRETGIPHAIRFSTKWEMALVQIVALQDEGLPPAPVVADAGYGDITEFRDRLSARGIPYVVGVKPGTTVWRPGTQPLRPRPYRGYGGRPTRVRRTRRHRPVALSLLAQELPARSWRTITWREGTRGAMRSRFALLRVRPAHGERKLHRPREVEWLLIEWPRGEPEPTKYWLSTMPADTPTAHLVRLAKIRWRIERDYEELKGEFGLDHFEGRGWRGFHHHGTLCIAAYAYLAAERARLSPPEPLSFLRTAAVPRGFKPRGSPGPTGAPRSRVHRNAAAVEITGSPATPALPRVWSSGPGGVEFL